MHRSESVDWLCLPRFDSPAVFASLLGSAENGQWQLPASQPLVTSSRRYRGETMILETDLTTASGSVRIVAGSPTPHSSSSGSWR